MDLDGPAARKLISALKTRPTAVTATLAVSILPVGGEKGAATVYHGWADVPAGWSRYWKSPYWTFISAAGWTPRDFKSVRQAQQKYREMIRRLDRAGVPILAGTDTPAPWVLPGAGLVRELEMLVESGLTPMSAIRAATGRAAAVLHKDAEVGTIRPGRLADLLILDGDPLEDIRALRRIDRVFLNGAEVDRAKLRQQFRSAHEPPPGKP